MGSLVEDHSSLFMLKGCEMLSSVRLIRGQKALKGEPAAGHARNGQGGHHRRAAGNGHHFNACFGAQIHQIHTVLDTTDVSDGIEIRDPKLKLEREDPGLIVSDNGQMWRNISKKFGGIDTERTKRLHSPSIKLSNV